MLLKNSSIASLSSSVCSGGGCGAGALLARKFSAHHTIVALPEMHAIQQYYLNGLEGIEYAESAKDVPPHTGNMLTGVWSLSECPYEIRDEFFQIPFEYGAFIISNVFE